MSDPWRVEMASLPAVKWRMLDVHGQWQHRWWDATWQLMDADDVADERWLYEPLDAETLAIITRHFGEGEP